MVEAESVEVVLNGRHVRVRPDRPVLDALTSEGFPILGRSLKYHRPRGPFCGVGQCAGCLVRVNGEPAVRACMRLPRLGDVITTERGWPSTRHDLFSVLDRLFPGHMDTMHGFTRPRFLRPLYTHFVRRFSGQGKVPDESSAHLPTVQSKSVSTLLVGGGEAASVVAEYLQTMGPSSDFLHIGHPKRPAAQVSLLHLPPPASGVFDALAYQEGEGALRIQAKRVILATGAYDASLVFVGNDLPGVLTGEGAESLSASPSGPPFKHALLFGGGSRAAGLLQRFEREVVAVASPGEMIPELRESGQGGSRPLYPKCLLLSASGSDRVRHATLRGREDGAEHHLEVDAIILAHRRLPHVSAIFQAGAKVEWRGDPGAYFPVVNSSGMTSVPGLFAVGEVAGWISPTEIRDSSQRAATSCLRSALETSEIPSMALPTNEGEMLGYYRDFLRQRGTKKIVLCPCEDVCLEELDGVTQEGWGGLESAKRISGVGMGLCQGRYCVPETILLLSLLEKRPPEEIGFITQRPPIWPVPLGALAGEGP